MTQDKSSFYYEPQVRYLYQVLEELGRGELRIPAFQRPFVWEDEDRTKLLESIRDGLPIGALLQWTAKRDVVHVEEEIAGATVPSSPQPLRQYLLDGKQRMTTLFGALKTTGEWSVQYDLKDRLFLVPSDSNGKSGAPSEKNRFLPMSAVLDSVALVRFQRGIHAESEAETDVWVQRSDELAKAFREYKLSIIVIATDDVEIATKTFQRVNSLGQRLTETHMVNALAWSPGFSLVDRLEVLINERLEPLGWGDLDESLLFRSVKVAVGLDAYESDPDRIAAALSKSTGAIEKVGDAFEQAIAFLSVVGVHRPSRLPYMHQLQMLAEAFRVNPQMSAALQDRFFCWFWVTTLDETFASPGGRLVAKMFAYVRELTGDSTPAWPTRRAPQLSTLPDRFDPRHARARGIMLLMDRPDAEPFRLFERAVLSTTELYNCPANRILCANAEEAVALGNQLRANQHLTQCPEALKKQVFSTDALQAAADGRLDDCLRIRERELIGLEENWFKEAWDTLKLDAATGAPF